MKTLTYLIASLAIAFALAGCAGSSNFDSTDGSTNSYLDSNYEGY